MELLIKQCEHNQAEEPCDKCTPQIEKDENKNTSEYDYYKRIWF